MPSLYPQVSEAKAALAKIQHIEGAKQATQELRDMLQVYSDGSNQSQSLYSNTDIPALNIKVTTTIAGLQELKGDGIKEAITTLQTLQKEAAQYHSS